MQIISLAKQESFFSIQLVKHCRRSFRSIIGINMNFVVNGSSTSFRRKLSDWGFYHLTFKTFLHSSHCELAENIVKLLQIMGCWSWYTESRIASRVFGKKLWWQPSRFGGKKISIKRPIFMAKWWFIHLPDFKISAAFPSTPLCEGWFWSSKVETFTFKASVRWKSCS